VSPAGRPKGGHPGARPAGAPGTAPDGPARTRRGTRPEATPGAARWSQRVTRESHALQLEAGVFTWADPGAIARSLAASAEASTQRRTTPFRSAMSMLNFYLNRAGRALPAAQRAQLEAAKDELRALYGRPRQGTASDAPRRRG